MRSTKEKAWLLREKYHGNEMPRFFADTKRLEAGEPLAYVIGWVDFLGCRIDLSAKPLIPRSETEFWVELVIIHQSLVTSKNTKILDLFAGSGCIGIALLKHLLNATVDFGEKDPVLCKQIKKNTALNNIDPARTRVIQTDVFSGLTGTYDYIFANPPYIDPSKKNTVQHSVLTYEPKGALFARSGGLFFIERLLTQGAKHLRQGGIMYIEFGHGQKVAIARLTRTYGWNPTFAKDQFGKWRVVRLKKNHPL
ncbi:MAG: hypothetical protein A3C93_01760 [Candidatus Lloydbacteria bacterium RIFCSPHIGHO2_02_FULL_54_17]|uniref:peptide chain release factor N(5)-glutamine methyltransferase n=1 Tax=Candidatus Lloydbacteria bacterium RIFCSPHIGHO2_02_FULL_54_17 TaxID=1798664 RepID=A0A1G2DD32_9BACT|nr:MAG: hypothetical protein A2762_03305 [Candidatus Lloydbacteria bacterium RIFCSPHIGHO2_01_FULL_54_11]OGZ11423.1 MAG: hypothetical protein A3C93_01760 [Candidatus Lloydbacteria bacterium RIFCSPHIGHO2_02_FULL_54_17]OGZ13717.1 MAG: hypothetical protein A2948_02020 [Candidatus Lloydbacteria bacterium RIFCSPLOWO2_01_FULL_54_18]OGZ15433.1 MAG: hypothetical protein A3H76_01375 [Candidatus Lloydbacteria bacterium RIFCSPLOWO2_02_FULL_54_12]